MTTKNTK